MKAILLAAGQGTRLHPTTKVVSKHLLPVYNYPMIYYPVWLLNRIGVSDLLLITNRHDQESFQELFGGGFRNTRIVYGVQEKAAGVADAILLGEAFTGPEPFLLALGDNIFYGEGFEKCLKQSLGRPGATIFAFSSSSPERFGVVEFEPGGTIKRILEKPTDAPSSWVVAGIYTLDADAVALAKACTPSSRQELEIADVLNGYLNRGRLHAELIRDDSVWFDVGTPDGLLSAGQFVQTVTQNGSRPFYGA